MSMNRILAVLAILGVVLLTPRSLEAQDALAKAKTIKCTFSVMTVATWGKDKPDVQVKPTSLMLEFVSVNADEGSAELKSTYGKYDIIVRYSKGYLHFIQSFLDGYLYVTTVLEKKTASGKLKGVHTRHEHTDVNLPGFTSSPEQYMGECEILS
jgi:hypothetical protein